MRMTVVLVVALGAPLLTSCADAPANPFAPADVAETALATTMVAGASTVFVTSDDDAGPGSFRAALQQANTDASVRTIRFKRGVGIVATASTLPYTGSQPLVIDGAGAVVDASGAPAGSHGLHASGGGDLTLVDLSFVLADGNGVLVEVPAARTGVFTVALHDVTLKQNALSGLYLDDQVGGSNPGGGDSAAGLRLLLSDVRVEDNGFRPDISDFDGVRVDEGGEGAMVARIHRSRFTGNAGDGFEIDETGNGDVEAVVQNSRFERNGTQPQNTGDLEDGFDIDENDAGHLIARLIDVTANGNQDEGVDLDEEGTGDLRAWFTRVGASANTDSNITFTEDEVNLLGGSITFVFQNVRANESVSDDGFKPEEYGDGDVNGTIINSSFNHNDDDGIQIEQIDAGVGLLRLLNVNFTGNGDDDINPTGVIVTGQ